MKKLILIVGLLISITIQGQEYSFVPDSLSLLPMSDLAKRQPPTEGFGPVYFENGTKTTLEYVLPLFKKMKLKPLMFVDSDGNYQVLVVKSTIQNKDIRIVYEGIPKTLENQGHSFGNPNSNTVIINVDGGPENSLRTIGFENIYNIDGGIDENNYFLINMRESQTLNPEETENEEISWEQARNYNTMTSKTLNELISFFKTQKKKVYVVGTSYGSFVSLKSIVDYKNTADGYLLMVGRLDMTQEVSNAYSKGFKAKFAEDAITPIIGKKSDNIYTVNMRKIAAALSRDEKYTELLEDTDLSNVTYIYSEIDQSVGKLTAKEIAFLKSKNAEVVSVSIEHDKSLKLLLKEGLEMLLKE